MKLGKFQSRGQRGITLVQTLVALGIFAFIGVAFISGLATAFRSQDINREQVTAENLVRAALEEIRFLSYQASYTPTVTAPTGYSISVTTTDYCTPEPCTPDANIQKNVVTISRDGETMVTVEDLNTKR